MLVLVLGMGRCGTSLLMQILHEAGFDCGTDWIPPNEHNPRGYYELRQVMHFNQSLLQHVCNRTDALFLIPDLESIEKQVGTPIPIQFPNHDFAVKDPRFSLTLPVWYPYLQQFDLRIIYARRNEEANAESLARAYYIDLPKAREMIQEYNRRVELYLCRYQIPFVTIEYDGWFADRQKNISALEQFLQRGIEIDWSSILDRKMNHCSGSRSAIPIEKLGIQSKPVSLRDIHSDLFKENLYAIEKRDPSLAEDLHRCKQDGGLTISLPHCETYLFQSRNQNGDLFQEWTIPRIFHGDQSPFIRYRQFRPEDHILFIVGIDALSLSCLAPWLSDAIKRLIVIEPNHERLVSYLVIHTIKRFVPIQAVSLLAGPNSFQEAYTLFQESIAGKKSPFFVISPTLLNSHRSAIDQFMQQFLPILPQ